MFECFRAKPANFSAVLDIIDISIILTLFITFAAIQKADKSRFLHYFRIVKYPAYHRKARIGAGAAFDNQ